MADDRMMESEDPEEEELGEDPEWTSRLRCATCGRVVPRHGRRESAVVFCSHDCEAFYGE